MDFHELKMVLLYTMEDNNDIINWLIMEELYPTKITCFINIREANNFSNAENRPWIEKYNDMQFYQLFRMKKETFLKLLYVVLENDRFNLIKKKYRGGNYPIQPERSLLIFIWYIAKQDTLSTISQIFQLAIPSVMRIVNVLLYIIVGLKKQIIKWPSTQQEFDFIVNGFTKYPGVVGVIDGSHINIKVPKTQNDSYTDRYLCQSINLLGICTFNRIFTYIFVGFPGSAHDARVSSYRHMGTQVLFFIYSSTQVQ
jgi:hypothetical protein